MNPYKLKKYKKIPCHTGVYFLFKDEEVVYIGQSTCIERRIWEHDNYTDRFHGLIDFDTYSFISIGGSKGDREIVERALIVEYNPKYNSTYNIKKRV